MGAVNDNMHADETSALATIAVVVQPQRAFLPRARTVTATDVVGHILWAN